MSLCQNHSNEKLFDATAQQIPPSQPTSRCGSSPVPILSATVSSDWPKKGYAYRFAGTTILSAISDQAKQRVMKALSKTALTASGIGFVAFPDNKFGTPQAAALASRRLREELQDAGLIVYDATNVCYRLSPSGHQWVEQLTFHS
jgi:hypothetical protein